MCGRFYIEPSIPTLEDLMLQMEKYDGLPVKTRGDVFPTDIVAARTADGGGADTEHVPMKWGFTAYDKKLIINARSETAFDKPMFRESMRSRRCLIPASGYYEWKRDGKLKVKHRFYLPGDTLYLAGCWRVESGDETMWDSGPAVGPAPRFVILTRAAAPRLAEIHSRMPVIIPREYAGDWLRGAMPERVVTELMFD
jgi:putative SOS response-associated peptidase YedK